VGHDCTAFGSWIFSRTPPDTNFRIFRKRRNSADFKVDYGRRCHLGINFGLAIVAEIAGEAVAQAIQLSIEYDPRPPFESGHPDRASESVNQELPLLAQYAGDPSGREVVWKVESGTHTVTATTTPSTVAT
jgi:hypothetical protein